MDHTRIGSLFLADHRRDGALLFCEEGAGEVKGVYAAILAIFGLGVDDVWLGGLRALIVLGLRDDT